MKRTTVDIRSRRIAEAKARIAMVESTAVGFERSAAGLEIEIAEAERKAGIADKAHFAYPLYAKAAAERRDNLLRSAAYLRARMVAYQDDVARMEIETDEEPARAWA